jgi:hypothetical protein
MSKLQNIYLKVYYSSLNTFTNVILQNKNIEIIQLSENEICDFVKKNKVDIFIAPNVSSIFKSLPNTCRLVTLKDVDNLERILQPVQNQIEKKEPLNAVGKILHLVLYSETDELYKEMYKITSPFYKQFNNKVTTVFYRCDNAISQDYIIQNDILLIKGEEVFENIYLKTIKAFEYFEKDIDKYQYIVRSNISSIVNFDALFKYFEKNTVEYGGSKIENLLWLDRRGGIKDSHLFGTKYIQGTCIILNKSMFALLLNCKDQIIKNLVDDVSIGVCIKHNSSNVVLKSVKTINVPKSHFNCESDIIVYRNKNRQVNQNNEMVDLVQMRYITDFINMHNANKLAYYTCFLGDDNNISNKILSVPSLIYDCFYFTNNTNTYLKLKNTKWKPIFVDIPIKNTYLLNSFDAKIYKCCPHLFEVLNKYEYTCYIDSKLYINETKILDHINNMILYKKCFLISEHSFIKSGKVFDEYYEATNNHARYYEEKDKYVTYIQKQIHNGYKDTVKQHCTTNFIIRKNDEKTSQINKEWYKHVEECGIMCQISFFFIQQIYHKDIYIIDSFNGFSYSRNIKNKINKILS